jgi:multidrug efflux pump subunit AcrB
MIKKPNKKGGEDLSWYQRFGLFFFTKARTTLLLFLVLASFGAVAYTTLLTREGFPDVSAPYSTVNGTYFVDDAENVDREVTKPLSDTIEQVDGVNQVYSQSASNFFNVQIEFKESVDPVDGNARVEAAVEAADILPESANVQFSPLFVTSLTPQGDDVLISVNSNTLNTQVLQNRAQDVVAALSEGGKAPIENAKRVQIVDAYQRGINPETGEQQIRQENFDWIGSAQDGELIFSSSSLIAVKANDGADILDLDKSIKESLAQIQSDPQFSDLQIQIAADLATDVQDQVNSLQENMIGGLIAVVAVTILLISWRASLIAALTMIVVLAITVGVLYLFGLTLNVIVLFSLILSLGLIVDDATIITEAIDKARRQGLKSKQAVTSALKKIALASVAGTLTTMLGFAPLLFVSGIMGEFIRAIPITLILSLAVSLVVSVSLIPFLARFIMLRGKLGKVRNPVAKLESKIAHGLAGMVRRLQTNRKQGIAIGLTAIAISLVLLVAGMFYSSKLQFNIFPQGKDGNVLVAQVEFDSESLAQTEETSRQVNQTIADVLGDSAAKVSYQGSGNQDSAQIVISLVPHQDREAKAPTLASDLQNSLNQISGVNADVVTESGGPPAEGFTMQIKTEDSQKATILAAALESFLSSRTVERANGTTAKITEVEVTGAKNIDRVGGDRYVQITAQYDADDISALIARTQQSIKDTFPAERLESEFSLPNDVMDFNVGQEDANQGSFQSMMIAFPILLLAMYILLVVQFRSLSQPLMIFLAIPFSFFGVTVGLYYTDNPMSFFVMLGIFALLGISVNNTILLTEYANQARKKGVGRIEAMARATEERFRPLLATSLTTAVALVPLAISDPFWEALAVTLIFGLLSSTFLVIIAFPFYYLGNELIRSKLNRWRVLIWLGVLIAGGVIIGMTNGDLLGLFISLYLLATLVWFVARAIISRRKRRAA